MVQVGERLSSPPEPAVESARQPLPSIPLLWYPALFVGLVAVGSLLRIHRLAERAIHHDESLHALYSWYLYVGRGYVHDPMMHGPWQFHWTALIYFLFGDSDFTARLAPALFGTALIGLPYFLRRELGRTGAIVASVLLAISPSFLKAVALVLAVDGLLFTTFLTNMGDPWNCLMGKRCTPGGLWTGTGGALAYWIAQHEVQRGGQPWFYYLILVPLYEFIPLILAVIGAVWRGARRNLFYWF